jgi:malonate-semialdehyde dehydrogenase (acetylating)/methylmalonate-semialdehyde dehydrogenase
MLRSARLTPITLRAVRGYASAATKPAAGSKYSPLAAAAAEEVSSKWKGTSAVGGKTKNYINGEFVESKASKWLEVRDPVST